jgi:mono/diheme cytochrome c family protein
MKKIFLTLPFLSLLIGLPVELSAEEQILRDWEQKTYVERGKYLVYNLAECVGCHTPLGRGGEGDPNMKLYLSGVPAKFAGKKKGPPQIAGFRGRKGARYYPKNLTPDPKTGIGKWTEKHFVRAFKEGIRPDGTKYDKSQMRWDTYGKMKIEDIRAMYRYLKTIKPIKNKVPMNIPPK